MDHLYSSKYDTMVCTWDKHFNRCLGVHVPAEPLLRLPPRTVTYSKSIISLTSVPISNYRTKQIVDQYLLKFLRGPIKIKTRNNFDTTTVTAFIGFDIHHRYPSHKYHLFCSTGCLYRIRYSPSVP